jgi:hypothetical protein
MISMVAQDIRAHKRQRVSWDATLHQDGRAWGCKVVDVSPGGAKIRIDERLTIDSRVMLTIDRRGDFAGEVRWQDENSAGLRFLEDRWGGPSAFAWLSSRSPGDLAGPALVIVLLIADLWWWR